MNLHRRYVGGPTWMLLLAATSFVNGACHGVIGASGSGSNGTGNAGTSDPANPGAMGDDPGPGVVGAPDSPDGVGWSTRFPKLSNQQWENTVRDIFYLDKPTGLSSSFVREPADKGYRSEAAATLTLGGDAWTRYQTAAEQVADLITGDDAKLSRILPANLPADPDETAKAAILSLGRRVYRRPLLDTEVEAYLVLWKGIPVGTGGDAFHQGMNLTIQAMLQSPHFLYRVEGSSEVQDNHVWLTGFEIASRLSYALWDTMPSDALLDAAAGNELSTKEGTTAWAQKMLDDPRASDVLRSFHEQTFATEMYGTQDKDASLGFDTASLAPVLPDEARQFFEEIVIQQNGGIQKLLTSPVAFVNATTSKFYEQDGVTGTSLVRVTLDATRRAGLLTQVGFLSQNAGRVLTDPVHRGLAVLRKVLCDEPNPPPMMFPTPMPAEGKTTRQVYEAATACGKGCHDTLINPSGFAFEHYDAVGKWRDTEKSLPLDAHATLRIRDGWTPEAKDANPSTTITFDGAVDLSKQLAALERTHECYSRRFLEFVLARPLDPVERGAGVALRARSLATGSARDILLGAVTLDTFRSRVPDQL